MMPFKVSDRWEIYNVLIDEKSFDPKNDTILFKKEKPVFLRIDSGCCTGQIFFDKTCECREQLHHTLSEISKNEDGGLLIHIPQQDGRGKGISFKLATLYLQNKLGLNTVEAAAVLSPQVDERTYESIVGILKFLKIDNSYVINLATNNPQKHSSLESNHFQVDAKPIQIDATEHTLKHLIAKQTLFNHTLGLDIPGNERS